MKRENEALFYRHQTSMHITCLMFADDHILFASTHIEGWKEMMKAIHLYQVWLGVRIKVVSFSPSKSTWQSWLKSSESPTVNETSLPMTHLGCQVKVGRWNNNDLESGS